MYARTEKAWICLACSDLRQAVPTSRLYVKILRKDRLGPEDCAEVEVLLADYQRRETLMLALDARASATLDAAAALLADGYPGLPEREIDPALFEALDQNRRSIELAQAQFRQRAITKEGRSVVGPEEPVPGRGD